MPEQRKLGDVDLYIPAREELAKAQKILEHHGYKQEEEFSGHHLTYLKEGHLQMKVRFPKLSKCPLLCIFFTIPIVCAELLSGRLWEISGNTITLPESPRFLKIVRMSARLSSFAA